MTDAKISSEVATASKDDQRHHDRCASYLDETLRTNITVHKLMDSISALGCKIPTDFMVCRKCDGDISGGFLVETEKNKDYKPQIVICQNKPYNKNMFQHTVIHELVHAYDMCKSQLDWKNCLHHACTEVRASTISGECNFIPELLRGKVQIDNGMPNCVKRRAEVSVSSNPYCKGIAKDAVETVFPKCYNDLSPYGSIRSVNEVP